MTGSLKTDSSTTNRLQTKTGTANHLQRLEIPKYQKQYIMWKSWVGLHGYADLFLFFVFNTSNPYSMSLGSKARRNLNETCTMKLHLTSLCLDLTWKVCGFLELTSIHDFPVRRWRFASVFFKHWDGTYSYWISEWSGMLSAQMLQAQQHLGSVQKFWALVLLEFVGQPDRMCDVEPDKLPTRTLPLTCPLDRGFTCIEASGWRSVLSVWH